MPNLNCAAVTAEGTYWTFCPNVGAAFAMCIFFGLTFVFHVAQGAYYRKAYSWVISMSALWQTIAYAFRIVSIKQPGSLGDYAGWFVLILVAPLWTNAFVYMVMGRMVWNYTLNGKVFGITARWIAMTYLCMDIVAFIVQVYGAAMATEGPNETEAATLYNLHIYMAGVGLQQFFILLFLAISVGFHRTIRTEGILSAVEKRKAMTLLYTLYAVLALITMRIIFRLCEYSKGLDSTIPNHEAYQYCLDSLPMLLALILLNIVHPGIMMRGKECDLPSRKERKAGIKSKLDGAGHGPTPMQNQAKGMQRLDV